MKFLISQGQAIRSVFGRSRVTHFMVCPLFLVEGEAGRRRGGDESRLGNLDPFLEQDGERDETDRGSEPAVDRLASDDDRGACDRPGGRCGCTLDEPLQTRMIFEAAEEAAWNDDE